MIDRSGLVSARAGGSDHDEAGPEIRSRALRMNSTQATEIKRFYVPSNLTSGPRGESSGSFRASSITLSRPP